MTATNWLVLGAAALLGYLLGSIPFGLLVTRAGGAQDPRTIGSGNIGATNVLRTGHKGLAAATLLLDAAKGAVAVLIAGRIWPDPLPPSLPAILAGAFAFLGHVYPVWLRFKGGKGVATFLGIALALSWPCGLAFALVWLAAFAATRHSSVGGMTAAIVTTDERPRLRSSSWPWSISSAPPASSIFVNALMSAPALNTTGIEEAITTARMPSSSTFFQTLPRSLITCQSSSVG